MSKAQELSDAIRACEREIFLAVVDQIQGKLSELHQSTGLNIHSVNVGLCQLDRIGDQRDYVVHDIQIDASLPKARLI
jgi:hypothetical protein